ncbi:MAG: type II secretion system F family protein [Candidatus Omnitrophica bacterium]|nr:type II secretion system F family protein [Candidatus Omnitrophota bacterium]
MLIIALLMFFLSFALLVLGLTAFSATADRPTLKLQDLGGGDAHFSVRSKAQGLRETSAFDKAAMVLRPLLTANMRRKLTRDLGIARVRISPESFFLIKITMFVIIIVLIPGMIPADKMVAAIIFTLVLSWFLPELWLRSKVNKAKEQLVKLLPDIVDLLGLCVSAGLDFMMALKWVVEKAPYNIVVEEMANLLQEISIGKPRRDALRDLAKKYELADLSTFTRTLIQADKMGTSVSEALTILSEDMRIARFRRGEAMALKAPLKMLVPLLFFIFPVVGILVGGPIFLDFMQGNPMTAPGVNKPA